MSPDKFKPGDVVHLNSGSPRLTIVGRVIDSDIEQYHVVWIPYGAHDLHRAIIPATALKS